MIANFTNDLYYYLFISGNGSIFCKAASDRAMPPSACGAPPVDLCLLGR